ncbi:hypothetical protein EDC04DRAFT_166878 [Pisolithus marmoratus]|nr:hypothetical protein EDC04DRAFT_166878 [Pisolithus marmoratus]
MLFIFSVIEAVMVGVCCNPTSEGKHLRLQIIEGLVDDDVWLWVDGDEAWVREKRMPFWMRPKELSGSEWADAQSALRRRIAQQRYPTVTGSHGSRNERMHSATPKQRVCTIAWLIVNSKGVAELFASHGRTPPTFRTPRIASILSNIIGKYWDAFPSHNSAWENALAEAERVGCICSPADCRGMRQWFNMMVWLEGISPALEVGYKSCVRCRSIYVQLKTFALV